MVRPITAKIRTCELATKPQTNNVVAWGLVFSYLLCNNIVFFLKHNNILEIFLVFTVLLG